MATRIYQPVSLELGLIQPSQLLQSLRQARLDSVRNAYHQNRIEHIIAVRVVDAF